MSQVSAARPAVAAAVDTVSTWLDRRKRAMVRDMHACGQSPAQLHVLGLLSEIGPTTVSSVATHLGVTPPSASAIVDRMVEAGLVTRERNEADRRVVTVSLSPSGRDTLGSVVGGRRDMLERVLGQLSDDELTTATTMLARLDEAIDKAMSAR